MELEPGLVTPGWFDLRPVVQRLPWPDVRGKRCLDVGPYDGFLSFELERRGAAEVLAVDIGSHEDWDWPPHATAGGADLGELTGAEVGTGFGIAKDVLGSLDAADSEVPVLTVDVDGPVPARIADVAPLALRHFGVTVPAYADAA